MAKPIKPIKARKRFGQNFLRDPAIIANICHAIHPQADDKIVEIGPGLGALTSELLHACGRIDVIELDRDLIPRLQVICDGLGDLIVHQGDALKFDFNSLATSDQKLRIVGNLPYNISTPLLFHLVTFLPAIKDMYFMLQHEVVQRMVATPNTADYGRLSVMLQYCCDIAAQFTVPPTAFEPQPKVMSAIVRLAPRAEITPKADNDDVFAAVVRDAFSLRRKTIRNSLAKHISGEALSALGFDLKLRAENLSVADFVTIANFVSKS